VRNADLQDRQPAFTEPRPGQPCQDRDERAL